MKYIALIALVFVASTSAVSLSADPPAKDARPAELPPAAAAAPAAPAAAAVGGADPEDAWITIPKFDLKVSDAKWGGVDAGGVPTERVGHADWLDKHVEDVKYYRSLVPPMPKKEDRVAVADS